MAVLSLPHPRTTVQRTFQPLRDQVKCSHCDTTFLTLNALKLHIDGNQCETFIQDNAEVPFLWHHPVILAGLSGGTFDHLVGYKSLVQRLGLRCGHFSQSSTSLLRHLGSEHGDLWTKYAEWLQTQTALAKFGCTCTRPPGGPHVCTLFTHLALFVHHDLHKFRVSDEDTVLTQALSCTSRCSALPCACCIPSWMNGWSRASYRNLSAYRTCAALSQCCSLCGRSVGANDMYLHLRHQHARDYTRGSLFYRYLMDMTPQTHQCSVCILHTTAAHECPILLQLAGLLCRLHHGHRGTDQNHVQQMRGVLKALTSHMEDEDGSLPQSKADRVPTKGKGKGKARKNHHSTQQPEDLRNIVHTLARLSLRHTDALRGLAMDQECLFLSPGPGSIMLKMMQATEEWHLTEPKDRTLPRRIKVLRVLLEELMSRVRKLQAARPEDELVQTLIKFQYVTQGENSNDLRFSFLQWNPALKALQIDQERQALTMTHTVNQLTKILTLLQQHSLIIQFGALRPNAQIQQNLHKEQNSSPQVIPWHLSFAMSHRRSAEILLQGCCRQRGHGGDTHASNGAAPQCSEECHLDHKRSHRPCRKACQIDPWLKGSKPGSAPAPLPVRSRPALFRDAQTRSICETIQTCALGFCGYLMHHPLQPQAGLVSGHLSCVHRHGRFLSDRCL